ncbi:hypothetical protein BJ508DRAFT_335546, partial [Ascobolus immersus RN42]
PAVPSSVIPPPNKPARRESLRIQQLKERAEATVATQPPPPPTPAEKKAKHKSAAAKRRAIDEAEGEADTRWSPTPEPVRSIGDVIVVDTQASQRPRDGGGSKKGAKKNTVQGQDGGYGADMARGIGSRAEQAGTAGKQASGPGGAGVGMGARGVGLVRGRRLVRGGRGWRGAPR